MAAGLPSVFSPTARFPGPRTLLLFGFLLESVSWRLIFYNTVRMVVFSQCPDCLPCFNTLTHLFNGLKQQINEKYISFL